MSEREEELVEIGDAMVRGLNNKVLELQQQLVAERELRERAENNMRVFIEKEHTPIVEQLREEHAKALLAKQTRIEIFQAQLAAAVEALQLTRPCIVTEDETVLTRIDATLAKIGGKC